MKTETNYAEVFDNANIWQILFKIAPPVMLALLIQALYNIVDSFFVGKYSGDGLTALSVIFPIQLVITAIAVGTGVGVNTLMAKYYAGRKDKEADATAGTDMVLSVVSWAVFAVVSALIMKPYVCTSAKAAGAIKDAVSYGNIVCIGSIGIFLESNWSKVHQAGGNMKLPMIAQIAGAVTNIILDPLLIFTCKMGVAGAAYATVAGQIVAAVITSSAMRKPPVWREFKGYAAKIYRLGYPSILMQMLYTVYIVALNIILAGFSDEAVTVLGLYYKLQTFFFIPLMGLQTCIVPLLSYTYTRKDYEKCHGIMKDAILFSMTFMLIGVACFEGIPVQLLSLFSHNEIVLTEGKVAFRLIGLSFLPAVISLILPVYFQAVGMAVKSVMLSLTRQIFCLIPFFYLFSLIGLSYTWLAFPVSEVIAGSIGLYLYIREYKKQKKVPKEIQKEMPATD